MTTIYKGVSTTLCIGCIVYRPSIRITRRLNCSIRSRWCNGQIKNFIYCTALSVCACTCIGSCLRISCTINWPCVSVTSRLSGCICWVRARTSHREYYIKRSTVWIVGYCYCMRALWQTTHCKRICWIAGSCTTIHWIRTRNRNWNRAQSDVSRT